MKSVCVFCGSSLGAVPEYRDLAVATGQAIAKAGITLVYGGARVGLMGAVADGALQHGGTVVGVLPRHLQEKEIAHESLSELHIVGSMHERKAMMEQLSDAFIALPGGVGTLEEVFEIWTWGQLGLHKKPCGLLNALNFYDGLIGFLDHQTREGFMKQVMRNMMQVADTPDGLLEKFRSYQPPSTPKWIKPDQT
ncbi:hypothetical protein JM93_00903 [Roseibium hamelinense]|uniref:Cytokinin riboside 5'-monophosphate phosphoribohydrolase n=1 Tax=Roseibium hamelinense TaxID=150831 RepID=A0A562TI54_9HYPH|nr:TIGR00730 family Rossman fold protein [Roseibium hamelinense]MTI42602.1 TIGR00730 family Rossman fold protein [Roseibium hamelinense]TWI93347.1 hypothetical protein JM93_00903 [Roseibium hamelinense]